MCGVTAQTPHLPVDVQTSGGTARAPGLGGGSPSDSDGTQCTSLVSPEDFRMHGGKVDFVLELWKAGCVRSTALDLSGSIPLARMVKLPLPQASTMEPSTTFSDPLEHLLRHCSDVWLTQYLACNRPKNNFVLNG